MRWRRRRPSSKRARSTTRSLCWPPPKRAPSTSSARPRAICCALRSRSPHGAAATHPRCCSRPPANSKQSTRRSRARPTWKRCPLRCSPAGWPAAGASWRSARPRLPGPPPPQPPRAVRPASPGTGGPVHRRVRGRRADPEGGAGAFRRETVLPPEEARWLWFASWIALHLWDDEAWTVLSTRHLELVRGGGGADRAALRPQPIAAASMRSSASWPRPQSLLEEELQRPPRRPGSPPSLTVRSRSPLCAVARPSFRSWSEPRSSDAQARGEGLALTSPSSSAGCCTTGSAATTRPWPRSASAERLPTRRARRSGR